MAGDLDDFVREWVGTHCEWTNAASREALYVALRALILGERTGVGSLHLFEGRVASLVSMLDAVQAEERERIVAWLRSYDDVQRRSALADRIEKGEHVGVQMVASTAPPLRPREG